MRQFEVDYETTLPPWHTGHEKIEAENPEAVKEKFNSSHEAARIYKNHRKYYMTNDNIVLLPYSNNNNNNAPISLLREMGVLHF